jgi:hypothetical protein
MLLSMALLQAFLLSFILLLEGDMVVADYSRWSDLPDCAVSGSEHLLQPFWSDSHAN